MAEQARGFMAPSKPAGVIGALLGMAERPDMTAELARISVSTLVIAGADDLLISPAESEALVRAIPGDRVERHPARGSSRRF